MSAGAAGPEVAGALVQALAPGAGLGIAVHDEDLRLLVVSPSLAELSGLPAEAQLGRRLTEAMPGEVGEVAEASLRHVAATGEPLLQLEPAIEAGRERGWLISVYPLESGGGGKIAVVALDVTESRRAQERLQRSRAMLATAQRLARVGSWVWDVEQDAWGWSDVLYGLIGLDPDGPPPDFATFLAAIAPESREAVQRATVEAVRDARPYELRFQIVLPNGTRRTVRSRGRPVFGPSGAVVRVEGFAQDVTELASAESHQRAAAVLGRLALSGMPIDALQRHAVDAVAGELELDYAALVVCRAGCEELVVRAISGGTEPLIEGREIVVGGESLSAYTLREGGPVIVRDWQDPAGVPYPPLAAHYGMRSSAAVVVGPREAPLGVLSGHAREAGRVGPEVVAFMETVANVVASAAERLRAEEEVAAQSAARGRLVAQALDAEDRTRREISEALHDGPLQDLLTLGHDVSRLRPAAEGDEHHIERVQRGIAAAIRQIREAMLDLHPVQLQVGGLESALQAICDQQARTAGYDCVVEIDAAASGHRDELVLSLAREMLRNVAKHAGAQRVEVRVGLAGEAVALEVVDDGCGFDPARLDRALGEGHIGLASSRERAEAIGGQLRVGPRGNGRSGTRAFAELPLG